MEEESKIASPKIEYIEVDENQEATLLFSPIPGTLFVYEEESGKLIPSTLTDKKIRCEISPYTNIKVYYDFLINGGTVITVGRQLIKGFLAMKAKTRLKDDTTGKIITGIFSIPKLKLMSNFTMSLGNDALPLVGSFSISAFPTGNKGKEKVMDLIILPEDIDDEDFDISYS